MMWIIYHSRMNGGFYEEKEEKEEEEAEEKKKPKAQQIKQESPERYAIENTVNYHVRYIV